MRSLCAGSRTKVLEGPDGEKQETHLKIYTEGCYAAAYITWLHIPHNDQPQIMRP